VLVCELTCTGYGAPKRAKGSLLREIDENVLDDMISLTQVSKALFISAAVSFPAEQSLTVRVRAVSSTSKRASPVPLAPEILGMICEGM